MAEGTSPNSYDEKRAGRAPEPELADATGRRQSVALNIVENPLKVRTTFAAPYPVIVSSRLEHER